MLVLLGIGLYKHISLQKEIKESCGYSTNKYYCICYDSNYPQTELEMRKTESKYNKPENINFLDGS